MANFIHLILTLISGGLWLPVWILCLFLKNNNHSKQQTEILRALAANEYHKNVKDKNE